MSRMLNSLTLALFLTMPQASRAEPLDVTKLDWRGVFLMPESYRPILNWYKAHAGAKPPANTQNPASRTGPGVGRPVQNTPVATTLAPQPVKATRDDMATPVNLVGSPDMVSVPVLPVAIPLPSNMSVPVALVSNVNVPAVAAAPVMPGPPQHSDLAAKALAPPADPLPSKSRTVAKGSGTCETYTVSRDTVRELVIRIAREEKLDHRLAEAMATVESDLGQNQFSSAGAVGIMQLIASTAAHYGVRDRCNPEQNIRGGIRYFKDLLQEFDSPVLALAAYNAGPRRVYEQRGIPVLKETAGYVVQVLNHWLDFDGQLKRRKARPETAAVVVRPDGDEDATSTSRRASDGAILAGDGVFIYK